jgi:hypothetical protein
MTSPTKKYILLLATIIFVLLTVGGYWLISHQNRITLTSGIEGTVTYGPLCPVEPCSIKPTFNFDIIAMQQNGSEAGHVQPDANGYYKLTLPPGTYQVKSSRSFGSTLGSTSPQTQVLSDRFTHLDLSFDTGIR